MFAIVAAVLFFVAAFVHGAPTHNDYTFWVLLAFGFWALHFAFGSLWGWAGTRMGSRQAPPG